MSFYPRSSRFSPAAGLLIAGFVAGLSACQRPAGHVLPSHREVFYSTYPTAGAPGTQSAKPAPNAPVEPAPDVPDPVAYADARPANVPSQPTHERRTQTTYPVAERIRQHQASARRLLANPTTNVPETQTNVPNRDITGPGPKKKKTLREILGLPARKKLNWWQRISWQLKAAVIVIALALVFAIFNVTILAIVFGLVGALLLIRGLRKSFKVRRPWF